jgi:putative nucleotidyltransferase with HDIG domain
VYSLDTNSHLLAAIELPVFQILKTLAQELSQEIYVTGGYVRDFLMKRTCKDIDIVTLGSGITLAKAFANRVGVKDVAYYERFGTAMVRFNEFVVEFVGARKESYRPDSRKPIVENGTLSEDQLRRDFTINTLSISLNPDTLGQLIDPFGGISDLEKKYIRTPTDPEITFSDDPLRMIRAIRFATQFDFWIEERTYQAIIRNKDRINIISQERITEELNKIILTPVPSKGFRLLFNTGLLPLFFKEMADLHGIEIVNNHAHKDNFYHTLKVLDNICQTTDNLWLRWAAILHDIAKPATKRYDPRTGWTFHGHEELGARMVPKIFQKLRLPLNEKMKYVQKLVRLHLRPIALVDEEVTDSAIRRLIVDVGADLDDLMKLCRADITTRDSDRMDRYLTNYRYIESRIEEVLERDQLRNWQPPITGEMIMKTFGIKPGKEVGIIKEAVRNAILDGEIPNDFEAAFNFMLHKAKELLNLTPVSLPNSI